MLSLGEQQRLAIGRAIISRAKVIFLDEASSAMDEGLEYAMYSLLLGRGELSKIIRAFPRYVHASETPPTHESGLLPDLYEQDRLALLFRISMTSNH
jgi:hypothetical protein